MNITIKIFEEIKEPFIPQQCWEERAFFTQVKKTYALERQIKPIIYQSVNSTLLVDRVLTINSVVGEDNERTDSRANIKQIGYRIRNLLY